MRIKIIKNSIDLVIEFEIFIVYENKLVSKAVAKEHKVTKVPNFLTLKENNNNISNIFLYNNIIRYM